MSGRGVLSEVSENAANVSLCIEIYDNRWQAWDKILGLFLICMKDSRKIYRGFRSIYSLARPKKLWFWKSTKIWKDWKYTQKDFVLPNEEPLTCNAQRNRKRGETHMIVFA